MHVGSNSPRGGSLRRFATALAVATAAVASVPASAVAGTVSGTVSSFTVTPGSTAPAGGATDITTTIGFTSTSPANTVKNITATLAPGLLAAVGNVPGSCSTAQLQSNTCPATSLIGTGSATTSPPTGTNQIKIYLMPAPNPAVDVAGVGYVFTAGPNAIPFTGTLDIITVNGQPTGQLTASNIPNAVTTQSLTLTINGNAPDAAGVANKGGQFVRLPTSGNGSACNPAPISVSVDTYDAANSGTGSDQFTPTGCPALNFAPVINGSAVKDSGDAGATVTTDITSKATDAGTLGTTLQVPSTVLQPNTQSVANLCQDPTYATCKTIGSASALTSLIPYPIPGKVYLTPATGGGLALSIVFPAPFSFKLQGVIDLTNNSTKFSNLPDVPLIDLKTILNGGPTAAFNAACQSTSGTLSAAFTGQNGKTANSATPFAVTGCPAVPPPAGGGGTYAKPGSPKVSGSLSGLAKRKATLRLRFTAGKNAPGLVRFSVRLPGGLAFIKKTLKKGVSAPGSSSVTLKGGVLIVTYKTARSGMTASITSKALSVSKGLAKQAKKKKIKSLKFATPVTDASGLITRLSLTIKKPS